MRPLLTLKGGRLLLLLLSSYFEGVSHRPPREFMASSSSSSLCCKRLLIDWKARSWQEIWQPEKTLVVGSTEKDRRTCWKFFGQAWRSLSVTAVHSTGNLIFQRLLSSLSAKLGIDFSWGKNVLMTLNFLLCIYVMNGDSKILKFPRKVCFITHWFQAPKMSKKYLRKKIIEPKFKYFCRN